jgi:general secretion pathway protein L
MSQTLFFRFTDPNQVEWTTGEALLQQGSLADLANRALGYRLILVIPGEVVTLTQARLPKRSRTAWLKALPYALEDNLTEDVENLHFALGEALDATEMPVAIISHQAMRTWLDRCAQAGISPVAIVPDILLLPYEEGSWSLLLENNRGLVRSGICAGFAAERDNLALLLGLALTEAGENAPSSLRVWGNEASDIAHLPLELRYQETYPGLLPLSATSYDSLFTLNLLQGPYSRKAHLGKWLRPWRTAAVLAGLWLVLQVATQVYEYGQLHRQQARLRAAMEHVYREAVPNARKIVNPRVQLENRLRELRQARLGSEAAFLDLLYHSAQPLISLQGVTLRGLRYKDDQLDLDLEGNSLEGLDQLKQRFSEQPNLNAEMRTTKREGKVESQVSLKRVSS